ncbi:MAG: pyrroloquinoline quinone (PQQ) biosynthesis protein C [Halieaceae bacterium]|jgi:pyrroloquinoline quinone (PQQ) biosynthesis protein C
MPFYEQLLQRTDAGKDYLLSAPIIEDVYRGTFSLHSYLAFLHQAYHHVRHTAPLLTGALAGLRPEQSWVAGALREYIEEEKGHEHWILDDIQACGFDREVWAAKPPSCETEMMVAYLYDYIARINPMGVFGMVLVLEGTSSSLAPAVAQIVQKQLALPDAAMTYLTTHGELDQDHIAHFERVMNKLTDPADQQAVVHVANRIYRLYGDVYRSIPSEAAGFTLATAA